MQHLPDRDKVFPSSQICKAIAFNTKKTSKICKALALLRGVLKIQLFPFDSFHAVGLAGPFPPMRSAWQAMRSAWQARG